MTRTVSHQGNRRRQPVLIGAAIAVAAALAAMDSQAQPRVSETGNLRIASWNLSDAAATGVIAREKPVTKSWRNTFGNERRVAAKPTFAGDRLKADVVLLQGVTSIGEVRQIFPANDWKLILSRQLLKLGGGRLNSATAVSGRQTITAVALRYQLRLRMTALEHLDNLAASKPAQADAGDERGAAAFATGAGQLTDTAGTTNAIPAPGPDIGDADAFVPDGLALRLAYSGSVIWVVSAELPDRCRTEAKPCEPAVRIKQWADGKRAEGFHVVIGGQLDSTLRQAGPNGICANQEIVADRALKAETGADTVAGCVAFADIGGS